MAMTHATKNSLTWSDSPRAATTSSTMRPKISMGSMPVWPTDCALMMVVTKESATTTAQTAGESPMPRQASSPAVAVSRPSAPASMRPMCAARPVSPSARPARARRSMPAALGRMSRTMTPSPEPIMRPMPRLETMPWALATSHRPAAVPPTMMPKLPSTAPANQKATAAPPTRKPTESSMGEL